MEKERQAEKVAQPTTAFRRSAVSHKGSKRKSDAFEPSSEEKIMPSPHEKKIKFEEKQLSTRNCRYPYVKRYEPLHPKRNEFQQETAKQIFAPLVPSIHLGNSPLLHQGPWFPRNSLQMENNPLLKFSYPPPAVVSSPVNSMSRTPLLPPPLPPNILNMQSSSFQKPSLNSVSTDVKIKTDGTNGTSWHGGLEAGKAGNAPSNVLDISTLLQQLEAAGVISKDKMKPEEMKGGKSEDQKENILGKRSSIIGFTRESLNVRRPDVISALHTGKPCASCGMRFKDSRDELRYSKHLDWHFLDNRKKKEKAKKASSREWYCREEEWVQLTEHENSLERKSKPFQKKPDKTFPQASVEIPTTASIRTDKPEVCAVCGEVFKLRWVDEEDKWHLVNAVRRDQHPCHPLCLEDYEKT